MAVLSRVPDWSGAACAGLAPETWFPSEHGGRPAAAAARLVCSLCPIVEACREYAIPRAELQGVWGGLTTAERARARAEQAENCLCGHARLEHYRTGNAPCRACDCDGHSG